MGDSLALVGLPCVAMIALTIGCWAMLRGATRRRKTGCAFTLDSSPQGLPPTIRRLLRRLQTCLVSLQENLSEHRHDLEKALPSLDEGPVTTETLIAALVGLAETNQRLQDRLAAAEQQLAQQAQELQAQWEEVRSDPLTHLPNRRVFEQALWQHISLFRTTGQSFTLAVFDVDHFKQINDTFGHSTGDEVLREVAQKLRDALPREGVLARIGGEEFALILPQHEVAEVLQKVEEIRLATHDLSLSSCPDLEVTLSCGVAIFSATDDPHTIFDRADAALYAAKQAGRDCTCFHDGLQLVGTTTLFRAEGRQGVEVGDADETEPVAWDDDPEIRTLTQTLRLKLQQLGLCA